MARFGSVCAVDENIDNLRRVHGAPVRHSAAYTNGESTQSYRHSAGRCRRRNAPESETANGVVLSRSASRSVGDLSSLRVGKLALKLPSNGSLQPRVDTSTARHQTAHLNGYAEHCQDPLIVVQNADGNAALAKTSDINVRILPESDKDKRNSDGRVRNVSYRTLRSRPSDGTACVSNTADDKTCDLTTANGVPILDYSNSNSDGKNFGYHARNNKTLRTESGIEYRVPNSSVNETAVDGFPSIDGGTLADGDARNEKRIVPRSESNGALAKVGDFDREREIERRMRELGLWEYKREQERRLAALLESQISRRDGLTAALGRCKRRQRGQAASAADDIRSHVNHHFIRDAWGTKVAYEVRILMGCFTRDVAYTSADNVVTVHGVTADPGITLTKEMTIELPAGVDGDDVTVTYTAGVVRIRAPFSRRCRSLARSATGSLGGSSDSSNSTSPSSSS